MYKRILVPLDGSELGARALPVAERLCGLWDAEMVVATFLVSVDDLAHRQQVIDRQTVPLRHRPRTIVRPIVHSVGDEIADEVHDHPDTLVVMATRAHARIGGLVGSVAESVLQSTRTPTLLIGPLVHIGPDWPTGPMVVCTDASRHADTIVPFAAAWQKNLGLQPWVIRVGRDGESSPSDTDDELSGVRNMALGLEQQSGSPAGYDVLRGDDVAESVVDHARREGAGLIALATHGASGSRRLVLGSVAMAVVHAASCPVLVVRP